MMKSLFASVAVLSLVLAAPVLAQSDRDNKDENAPRAGHVSRDSDTNRNKPNEQNRERPPASPTVAPTGTMGGETRGKPEPSGTMGTERGTRHEHTRPGGTTTAPTNATRTMAPRTGTMAPRTGAMAPRTGAMAPRTGAMAPRTGAAAGTHVHNPKYNTMRRTLTAPQRFHAGTYVQPSGFYVHHWTSGEFLPDFFFVRTYWILDWSDFALVAPIPGTVWVRVGDDALLIDEFTGEVIIVEYGVFF